jgi:hypothetical protein
MDVYRKKNSTNRALRKQLEVHIGDALRNGDSAHVRVQEWDLPAIGSAFHKLSSSSTSTSSSGSSGSTSSSSDGESSSDAASASLGSDVETEVIVEKSVPILAIGSSRLRKKRKDVSVVPLKMAAFFNGAPPGTVDTDGILSNGVWLARINDHPHMMEKAKGASELQVHVTWFTYTGRSKTGLEGAWALTKPLMSEFTNMSACLHAGFSLTKDKTLRKKDRDIITRHPLMSGYGHV